MSAVERAAGIIHGRLIDATDVACEICLGDAQALADAGLLVTDADRAVLYAADEWMDASDDAGVYRAADLLETAVRARREAQS